MVRSRFAVLMTCVLFACGGDTGDEQGAGADTTALAGDTAATMTVDSATNASGTVLMPTASTPSRRSIRISAGDSKLGPESTA